MQGRAFKRLGRITAWEEYGQEVGACTHNFYGKPGVTTEEFGEEEDEEDAEDEGDDEDSLVGPVNSLEMFEAGADNKEGSYEALVVSGTEGEEREGDVPIVGEEPSVTRAEG